MERHTLLHLFVEEVILCQLEFAERILEKDIKTFKRPYLRYSSGLTAYRTV